LSHAVKETGFFGNRGSGATPRALERHHAVARFF